MTNQNKYAAHAEMLHKDLPSSVLEFWIETAKALLIEAGWEVEAQAARIVELEAYKQLATTAIDDAVAKVSESVDYYAAPVAPAQPQDVNAELVQALKVITLSRNIGAARSLARTALSLANAKATPVQEQKECEL